MSQSREKIIQDLKGFETLSKVEAVKIADYIIADRKRVVEPLVKLKNNKELVPNVIWVEEEQEAIDETLRNAGVER